MAGLVPAIHVPRSGPKRAWITGTSPVMTTGVEALAARTLPASVDAWRKARHDV